jgi:hypothetical protein
MKIQTILDQIDLGAMALPEFQRGYVWNRDQVKGLIYSLYRKHPVGSLLVWVTRTENADARGEQALTPGSVKLLLDGQQRITSLYGLMRGKPPRFFEGNAQAFTGLYFNLEEEVFEFYMPAKMKDDPLWLSVSGIFLQGAGATMQKLLLTPSLQQNLASYLDRINRIENIRSIDLHMEEVAGEDKTVDVVVDIFNRVNSGGTKLSKGDLTLAKICAEWPDARSEMKKRLDKWRTAGYVFRLDWLLRNINAVVTGKSLFTAMKDLDSEAFRAGLEATEEVIDRILNLIASRLGLDHDRVLGSRYSIPLMSRYLLQRGGKLSNHHERDNLLYWFIHTMLWGRYSGSTESVLATDLESIVDATVCDKGHALDRLIENLRRERANLKLNETDFSGSSKGNRFYPMLYMMTRVCHARDWASGDELKNHLLGNFNRLEIHHVFPKAILYKHGYSKRQVNAIANFTFLTKETNLEILDADPSEYLPKYDSLNPGAIQSHWMPMDPKLWRVENYLGFLSERRKLLAEAANKFLNSLMAGTMPCPPDIDSQSVVEQAATYVPGGIADDEEESKLLRCNKWVMQQGLAEGELDFDLLDGETHGQLAVLDLAWPRGLQEGLTEPVALLIDEDSDVEELASQAGFRFFTSMASFRRYVKHEILAQAVAAAEEGDCE